MFRWGAVPPNVRKTKHYKQLVSSCPALASPALFWFCLAHAQRAPESGRSRGGFRNVSFSHLQRTRQGREAGRPHYGQDGFRQGTKRSGAPTLGLLTLRPRRKGFLPLKLREALRKSGRLPAFNFPSRPVLRGHNRPPSPSPPPLPAARLSWVPRPTRPRPAAICPDSLFPPRPPRWAPGRGHRYLPRGWSSCRRLLRFRSPLQMETVVPDAWDALLRLRPHSSSMPRAPRE